MNFPTQTKKIITGLLTGIFMATTLTGCSDDKSGRSASGSMSHTHNPPIANMKKHSFEHKFADQCVKRELKNSINKKADRKRFEKSCLCIATRIMKDLDEVQAEKFLKEKKNTHTMRLSFDEAAYFCLQRNAKPKAHSFKRKITNKSK